MQDILNTSALVSTAPSISSSAMIVDFNASVYTARKKDVKASEDICRMNAAERGMADVRKKLLGNCEELTAIQKFAANTRNMHYSMTMPWSDNGSRLLPTAQYFRYNEVMTDLQNEFHRLVDEFLGIYENRILDVQTSLSGMFAADEYLSLSQVASKFGFRVSYVPLPDNGDFRLDIGNEAMAQIKTQYQQHYTSAVNAAMKDVWQKLHDNLTTLARQLGVNEEGKGNKLYDTVFDRALELTDMLGTCNVTGDSQMEAMRQRLEQAFHGLTIGRIKNSPTLREGKQKELAKAIAAIPSLGF